MEPEGGADGGMMHHQEDGTVTHTVGATIQKRGQRETKHREDTFRSTFMYMTEIRDW